MTKKLLLESRNSRGHQRLDQKKTKSIRNTLQALNRRVHHSSMKAYKIFQIIGFFSEKFYRFFFQNRRFIAKIVGDFYRMMRPQALNHDFLAMRKRLHEVATLLRSQRKEGLTFCYYVATMLHVQRNEGLTFCCWAAILLRGQATKGLAFYCYVVAKCHYAQLWRKGTLGTRAKLSFKF